MKKPITERSTPSVDKRPPAEYKNAAGMSNAVRVRPALHKADPMTAEG